MTFKYEPKLTTLPNGIRVVSISDSSKIAKVTATFLVGSVHETTETAGVSHFVEHLMYKGTKNRTCFEIMSEVENLGANANAHTEREITSYEITGLAEHVENFIELLGDQLINSTFPADEVEKERNVVLQEMYEVADCPPSHTAYYNLFETAFKDQSYGRRIIGSETVIETIPRENLIEFVNQYYVGNNLIVAVAGGIDHEHVVELVAKHFANMPAGKKTELPTPHYTSGVMVEKHNSTQNSIIIGLQGPPLASHDAIVSRVIKTVLSDGMSSPLFKEVREVRGLAYSIYASGFEAPSTGMFFLSARTTPENTRELISVVVDELKKIRDNGADETDLKRAINQIKVSYLARYTSAISFINFAVKNLVTFGEFRDLEYYVNKYSNTTQDEIRAVASQMLESAPVFSLVGNDPEADTYYDFLSAKLAS